MDVLQLEWLLRESGRRSRAPAPCCWPRLLRAPAFNLGLTHRSEIDRITIDAGRDNSQPTIDSISPSCIISLLIFLFYFVFIKKRKKKKKEKKMGWLSRPSRDGAAVVPPPSPLLSPKPRRCPPCFGSPIGRYGDRWQWDFHFHFIFII